MMPMTAHTAHDAAALTKSQLRTRVRTVFPTLAAQGLARADAAIERHLIELLGALQLQGVLGGYQPIQRPSFHEPQIDWGACAARAGLVVAFPLVDKGHMIYRTADGVPCVPQALVIPAVGYDMRGYRLGHGAGNFDKYLTDHTVRATIGVVYAWQIIATIPTDAWDRPVQWIVTDDGIHRIAPSGRSQTGSN